MQVHLNVLNPSQPFISVERRHTKVTSQNLPHVINPAPYPTPNPETDPSVVEIKIQVKKIRIFLCIRCTCTLHSVEFQSFGKNSHQSKGCSTDSTQWVHAAGWCRRTVSTVHDSSICSLTCPYLAQSCKKLVLIEGSIELSTSKRALFPFGPPLYS